MLIVDADTILSSQTRRLSSVGVQVSAPAGWLRGFWTDDVEKSLGVPKSPPFSYITYHQLMQKDIMQALLGALGERLVNRPDTAHTGVSEYDSYGSFWQRAFPRGRDTAVSEMLSQEIVVPPRGFRRKATG